MVSIKQSNLEDSDLNTKRKAFPIQNHTRTSSLRRIVIIGGGCSGVLAALAITRASKDIRPHALDLVILDPSTALGSGVAYGTKDPQHLLNVPAARMSAYADEPDDFFFWLKERNSTIDGLDFVSRELYGQYLHKRFESSVADSGSNIKTTWHRLSAIDCETSATGSLLVTLSNQAMIEADAVILATGLPAVHFPTQFKNVFGQLADSRLIVNPWNQDAIQSITSSSTVCLLGSGLTAIDVALSLSVKNFTGSITMLSRHGLAPMVHEFGAKAIIPQLDGSHWSPLELLRWIRAESEHLPWRLVIDSLRPRTQALWQGFSDQEKRAFLRHLKPYWDVHRHRMAPQIAKQISGLKEKGIIKETLAGTITSVRISGAKANVTVQNRKNTKNQEYSFDYIVNCTGLGSYDSTQGLLGNLKRRGFIETDEIGIRLPETTSSNSKNMFILGPLLRGKLWETIAVPDIRIQAKEIAESILSQAVSSVSTSVAV